MRVLLQVQDPGPESPGPNLMGVEILLLPLGILFCPQGAGPLLSLRLVAQFNVCLQQKACC